MTGEKGLGELYLHTRVQGNSEHRRSNEIRNKQLR